MDLNKPYPHEHAARLYEPAKLDPDTYGRTSGGKLYGGNVKVPASIDVIWAHPKGSDHPVAQALRFPADKWTEEKARTWLKENGVHSIKFEPAAADTKKCDTDALVEAWDVLAEHYNHSYEKSDRRGIIHSALYMKIINDELGRRKDVVLRKISQQPVREFVIEQRDIRDIIPGFDGLGTGGCPVLENVRLLVLDKEPTPVKGILKYSLGLVLDGAKAARGDNIAMVAEAHDFDSGARLDEAVPCSVIACTVQEKDGFFVPELTVSKVGGKAQGRLRPAKSLDVIKDAHKAGVLEAGKETIIKLAARKSLDINVDRQYGIGMDKTLPLLKLGKAWEEGIVYGIVYRPNEVDTDGDYTTPEEVQKACWRFMTDYQTMNLMHNQYLPGQAYDIVECGVARADEPDNGIKKGDWWIGVRVKDPELKQMIEQGEITAFSMEGSAMPGEEIPNLEAQKRRAA